MFGRSNVVFFLGFVCLYQWMWRVENLLLFLTEQST
jgi:hypothetical protein